MATKKVKSQIQKRAPKKIRENKHDGTKFKFSCKGEEFEMNDSQKLFCMKYVELQFNGRAAAIAVGYEPNSAHVAASRLVNNDNVKRYINILKDDLALQIGVSAAMIANEYKKIGFANIKNLYDEMGNLKSPQDLDDDTAAAISGIEYDDIVIGKEKVGVTTKMKRYDKLVALDKLAKMTGVDGVLKVAQTDTEGNDIVEITNTDE
jgi:phage terminase small subunit